MLLPYLRRLMHRKLRPSSPGQRPPRRKAPASFRPWLEGLEDRTLPSTVNWIGAMGASGNWNDASKWEDAMDMSHHVPGQSDDAVINVSGVTVTHNNAQNDPVQSVSVSDSSATLSLTTGTLNVSGMLSGGQGARLLAPRWLPALPSMARPAPSVA
jgi:hypothetical protein